MHPERSRQHGTVHQRRVPDGDAAGAAARASARSSRRRARWRRRSARKADAFASVLKVGRTHLQDAVPITLGQEFGGYAACIERAADDVERASDGLKELNLGATAVGTGLNAGDDYTARAVANISALHGHRRHAGGESLPRHAEHGRRARLLGRACGVWPWSCRRSPATCGCSAWDRARGWRDRAAGGAARARRSCRARSIRRCPRW